MKKMRGMKYLPQKATYDEVDSPVGNLTIVTSSEGLHAILWSEHLQNAECQKIFNGFDKNSKEETIIKTKKQLQEYFQGKRKTFDIPLAIRGTEFQIQAWKQLLKIPYGQTISYGKQAEGMGDKNKARAVGMANGLNSIAIVIPCHRVIGGNGDLVGFGGGLDKKVYLLELEQRYEA